VEEETSNGFHVFELHMPTMGANVVLLLIIVLAAIAVWRLRLCRSLRKRRGGRKEPSFDHYPLQPLPTPQPASQPAAPAAPPPPQPPHDYVSPAIALLTEQFMRAMSSARVAYEEEEERPRTSTRKRRAPSPVFQECRRFEEVSRRDESPIRGRGEDKAVETPRTFSFSHEP
jgi:type IV secretory pathway VirB10-like protein